MGKWTGFKGIIEEFSPQAYCEKKNFLRKSALLLFVLLPNLCGKKHIKCGYQSWT